MVNLQLPDCDRYYNSSSVLGCAVLPLCEMLSIMSGFVIKVQCTDQRYFCFITPLFYFELHNHQDKWEIVESHMVLNL